MDGEMATPSEHVPALHIQPYKDKDKEKHGLSQSYTVSQITVPHHARTSHYTSCGARNGFTGSASSPFDAVRVRG
jgi:hypothetical protein